MCKYSIHDFQVVYTYMIVYDSFSEQLLLHVLTVALYGHVQKLVCPTSSGYGDRF